MSWRVTYRGDPSAPIRADYVCPAHGRFEATVPRGDMDTHPCHECGEISPWTPSSPRIKRPMFVSAHRGKSDPPPFPEALDTEALADGMPYHEWRDRRREIWAQSDYAALKAKT